MKNKLIKLLLLFVMMIFVIVVPVVPVRGHTNIFEYNFLVQNYIVKTNSIYSLYAGAPLQFTGSLKNNSDKFFVPSWEIGYVMDKVTVKKNPFEGSDTLATYDFNSQIIYAPYNESWVKVLYKNSTTNEYVIDVGYVQSKYVTDIPRQYKEFEVPKNNGFKSYMSYMAITDKTSKQYLLQQIYAHTGYYGIRQVDGRYCVAIGTAFGANIGDYGELILENKIVIPIIVSDIKADKDTDYNNIITTQNGCVSEFIVDINSLNNEILKYGDVSSARESWESSVTKIKIYNKNIFE